jgi:hypothetical protein
MPLNFEEHKLQEIWKQRTKLENMKEEFTDLFSSPSIVRVVEPKSLEWACKSNGRTSLFSSLASTAQCNTIVKQQEEKSCGNKLHSLQVTNCVPLVSCFSYKH